MLAFLGARIGVLVRRTMSAVEIDLCLAAGQAANWATTRSCMWSTTAETACSPSMPPEPAQTSQPPRLPMAERARSVRDHWLDQGRQLRERLLPAEIAHLDRDGVGDACLRDVQLGAA